MVSSQKTLSRNSYQINLYCMLSQRSDVAAKIYKTLKKTIFFVAIFRNKIMKGLIAILLYKVVSCICLKLKIFMLKGEAL